MPKALVYINSYDTNINRNRMLKNIQFNPKRILKRLPSA